jgi:ankyrin repeat protein
MRRRWIALITLFLLVCLCAASDLWLRAEQRQYALNRQLIAALMKGDDKQALALVNEDADPNTCYKPKPVPSLRELVRQLLRRPPPSISKSLTALLIACGATGINSDSDDNPFLEEVPELVQAMIQHGAKINAKDASGHTPLFCALLSNRLNTVRLLLEHGADANEKDEQGNTPLMLAIGFKLHPAILHLLLQHGANVNAPVNEMGWTLLMMASSLANAQPETVRLLLEHGADVNAKDKDGRTALFWAVGFIVIGPGPNEDAVRQLLAHGANPHVFDNAGYTPLRYASPDIASLLKQYRARK